MSARVLLNAFSPTTADKVTPKNKATGIAGRCVVHIYMFIFDPYPSSSSSSSSTSLLLLFDIFDNPAGLFLLFMFHVYHPIAPMYHSGLSNRQNIRNALCGICLGGPTNDKKRFSVLQGAIIIIN
jgi:hypothetical protein